MHGSVPDLIASGLRVLFCGINPGMTSGATGHHFAKPGNRFWPALYQSGFTPRLLRPDEQDELLTYGLGITNLVARTTARASELRADELKDGAIQLGELARRWRPVTVAVVGVTAYRTAFGRAQAGFGEQPELLGSSRLWVLPNPSGLNAHFQLDDLVEAFTALRLAS